MRVVKRYIRKLFYGSERWKINCKMSVSNAKSRYLEVHNNKTCFRNIGKNSFKRK